MKTKADLPLLAGLAHGVNIKLEKAGGLRAALAGNTFFKSLFWRFGSYLFDVFFLLMKCYAILVVLTVQRPKTHGSDASLCGWASWWAAPSTARPPRT
jgi:hypothetical protein